MAVNYFDTSAPGSYASPSPNRRRIQLAQALGQKAATDDTVYSHAHGVAKLGTAALAGIMEARAEKELTGNNQALAAALLQMTAGVSPSGLAVGGAGEAGPAGASAAGGSAKAYQTNDPVATDLAPHQRAFLNAVAGGESGGKYNIRYTPSGGTTFDDLSKHPAIYEPGPEGPSSAAGRYQFVKSTWDRLGGGDFSPENQDRKAWQLATQDYNARTGRDLDGDLQSGGLTPDIVKSLGPTWSAFKTNPERHIATYRDSLGRYGPEADTPLPGARAADMQTGQDGFVIPPASQAAPAPGPMSDASRFPPEMVAQALRQGGGGEAAPDMQMPFSPPVEQPEAAAPQMLAQALMAGGAPAPWQTAQADPAQFDAQLAQARGQTAGLSIEPGMMPPEMPPAPPQSAPMPPERPPETYAPRAPQVPPQAMAQALQSPPIDPNSNDAGAKQFAASGMGASPKALAGELMRRSAPGPQDATGSGTSDALRSRDLASNAGVASAAAASVPGRGEQSAPSGGFLSRIFGSGQQPAPMPTGPGGAPLDARQAAAYRILSSPDASPAMQQAAIASLSQKPTQVDLGDAVGLLDQRGNLIGRVPKTKFSEYGVIGKDQLGNEQYGWRNASTQQVTPASPQGPQQPLVGPDGKPLPPDVDPKLVRDARSKSYAEGALPADPKTVSGLRKEVQDLPSYKNLAQAAPVFHSMRDAAGRDTRAADVNLIYGLAKVMDPASVVRESEMTVAKAIATFPEQLRQTIESQLTSTGRLSAEVRAQIMQEAHSRLSSYETMFNQDASMYRGIAQRGRMNEADVLPSFGPFKPYEAAQKPGSGGLQPGDVRPVRPGITIQRVQ